MEAGPFWCLVCKGRECKGGTNNATCALRDKRPSIVAGILDTYGGLRCVVEYRDQLKHHARHDEVTIIVPNFKVHEPIGFTERPMIEALVLRAVNDWIGRRGIPNEPHAREAVIMYGLRQLENPQWKRSFDPSLIVET
jgi:hypothetical protein